MNRTILAGLTIALAGALLPGSLSAQEKVQHWSGTATVHDQQVPVRLDLSSPAKDGSITGSFINGDETSVSSSGDLSGTHLLLNFNYFARKFDGTLADQTLTGTFSGATGTPATLELHPDRTPKPTIKPVSAPIAHNINGDWEIAVKSPKGESAWTLRVKPLDASGRIKAVILRIDGDTGGLYGDFDEAHGEYRVSRFAASGATLYSIKLQTDGTLLVTNLLRDNQQWTARLPAEARKENLPPPTIETEQTGVLDPSKPLQFSALTLDGKTVTNTDPQFRGKVVIVAIGGSWCPNCHDEAPFLVELYKRYHAQGLEIVNLSFEEEEQLKNPERLRAFQAKYHIPYTVLVAGTPDQLSEKVPQGKNLNCWPTSFFIGRDGLVKETHAGFSGPATGAAYTELKAETNTLVQKLLTEKEVAQR